MGAFHAYDIRGIYNVDFDRETAYKVAYFIPELLGTDKVAVGRDCRVSSDEIHDAVPLTAVSRPRYRLRRRTMDLSTTA